MACDAVKQPAPADEAERRSNKGAAGVDGQDFADIEAYGVELASAPLQ